MKKMIILFDQDGVLVQTEKRVQQELKRRRPDLQLVNYFMHNEFLIENLYPPEVTPVFEEIWAMPGLFYSMEPIPGAKEALEEMTRRKHEVFICTQPNPASPTCVQEKYDSIRKHFGRDWERRTILTYDKTLVHGDIIIDDKPTLKGVKVPSWEHVAYGHLRRSGQDTRRRILSWSNWREVLLEI